MGKELSGMSLDKLWEMFPVSLIPHSDKWDIFYVKMETELRHILADCNIERISHIGSTAIPEIWAKNIVDILIEIPVDSDIEAVAQIIEHKDFIRMSAGECRISFNSGYTPDGFAEKVFHLHLRYAGDNDELYFRDYLREHPKIAKEYEALKLSLWKQFEHDRDAYTDAKTEFIRKWTDLAKTDYAGRY